MLLCVTLCYSDCDLITKRERRWHSKGPQIRLYNTFRISLLAVFKPQKLLFWSKVSYNIRRNIRDLSQSLHSKCIWSQWHLMKKARNYLFTSGNKFQDNNCTWLSGSMNNEYATSPKLHLVHRKWMGMNSWPINQNAKKFLLITRCRMLWISALFPEMQSVTYFTSLPWKMLSAWDH